MSQRGLSSKQWFMVVGTILFCAIAFVVGLFLSNLGEMPWGNWQAIGALVLIFGVVGAFFGTIVALDGRSGMSQRDRPILRTLLCGVLAA